MATAKKQHPPLVQDIIDGKHDEDLALIARAAQWRLKNTLKRSFRKGQRIRVLHVPGAGDIAGREGTVEKVNQKTVSINLACPKCDNADPNKWERKRDEAAVNAEGDFAPFPKPDCDECNDFPEAYRVSPGLIEAVA